MSSRSRKPGSTRTNPFGVVPPQSTPGPLGKNDYADPLFWLGAAARFLFGDTPGPVGVNDHADPAAHAKLKKPVSPQPSTAPATAASKSAGGPLQVSQGQITFDAEGNDNSASPYFSRVVQWPGNAGSGVTLGRGYDMGDRSETQVIADLTAAGLPADKAKEFAKGAGKKGADAEKFVKENKSTLGEISTQVQKNVFENIYPTYVKSARANYEKWTKGDDGKALAGKVEWEKLDPAIRDILVDFVYQGFTKGANPMVKGMKNDFDELMDYVKTTPALKQYEPGRNRVEYLKSHRPQKSTPAKPDLP